MTSFQLILGFTTFFTIGFIFYFFLLNKTPLTKIKKKNDKGVRWASQTKPVIGGIGFYILFVVSILLYTLLFSTLDIKAIGIFCTVSIAFFMGLLDDTRNTSPLIKFAVQIVNALILISCGIYIKLFNSDLLNYSISFLWIVGLMNSLNMLDNMDAITGSNSLIILFSGIAGLVFSHHYTFHLFYTLGVAASILAFLRWNWNPSKVYMGDNGSQLLGTVLAVVGIVVFWNNVPINMDNSISRNFIAVILAFIVPLSDTTTVTINRLKMGKSPFVGGRDHTTHHLSYLGLSDKQVALVLMLISVITNFVSFYILFIVKKFTFTHFIAFGSIAFIIFVGLYSTTIITKPKLQ